MQKKDYLCTKLWTEGRFTILSNGASRSRRVCFWYGKSRRTMTMLRWATVCAQWVGSNGSPSVFA